MANLLEIAELTWRSIFPVPNDKTSITKEEFIATAKTEYAASMWLYRQEEIAINGFFQMPSDLLTEVEMDVTNKTIDLSKLKYLSALPNDLWLQDVGGENCECKYVKSTLNLSKLLCDDNSLSDSDHVYFIVGKKIKFVKEPHAKKLTITYANTGTDLDERKIEVSEYIASKVRIKLLQLYGAKVPADITNDNNPNQ